MEKGGLRIELFHQDPQSPPAPLGEPALTDVFDLDINVIGREIHLEGTVVGLYDIYSGSGQGQAHGTIQVDLGGPASLVIQGTGPQKSVSVGAEIDFAKWFIDAKQIGSMPN